MSQLTFYFHDLEIKNKTGQTFILSSALDEIKKETDNIREDKPDSEVYHVEQGEDKLSVQIFDKITDGTVKIYVGKFIYSEDPATYNQEINGKLCKFEYDEDEEVGICHLNTGTLYFLIYVDEAQAQYKLMLEYMPLKLNIGGFKRYFIERYKNVIESLDSRQILGKDLVRLLDNMKDDHLKLARIKLKKNLSDEKIDEIGYVDDILEKAKDKNLELELILRWPKENKTKVAEFLKSIFKVNAISDLSQTNFSDFFVKFSFETDNTAQPEMNIKKRILTYLTPETKE
ncbi:MAG: hypothetical protein WC852_06595, partial [Candidatus Nanoarchaeia archaeon]